MLFGIPARNYLFKVCIRNIEHCVLKKKKQSKHMLKEDWPPQGVSIVVFEQFNVGWQVVTKYEGK